MSNRPYLIMFGVSVGLFLIATLGSDVVMRVSIGGESVGHAITEHVYYALVQPVGTVLLLSPFLALGWMSASIALRKGIKVGLVFLLLSALLLELLYFFGYKESQEYMKQHLWTAATLSVGLLPLKGAVVVLLSLFFRWLIVRDKKVSGINQ